VQLVSFKRDEFVVFLSSGQDAVRLRDMVDDLVLGAVNSELLAAGLSVRLMVDRWERGTPRRVEGESINAAFVRRARASSLALCFVIKRLGKYTQEEIEAVLDAEGVGLSIIWFIERDAPWPRTNLGKFLRQHGDVLVVDRAGPPDGEAAIVSLVRVLLHIILQALAQEVQGTDGYRERR
jgi:hypothetical protein